MYWQPPQFVVNAATFTANSTTTLTSAINSANGNSEADTITITGNITLSAQLPAITSDITIEGGGNRISGASVYGIFFINGGTVVINNLTMTNGRGIGDTNFAGFQNPSGGAIRVHDGSLTVSGSTFRNNRAAQGQGGAIFFLFDGDSLTITDSHFADNYAHGHGGAVAGYPPLASPPIPVRITNSTFRNNTADTGGALLFEHVAVTIRGSEFTGNSARIGGGLSLNVPSLTVTGDTVFRSNTPQNCVIQQDTYTVSVPAACEGGQIHRPRSQPRRDPEPPPKPKPKVNTHDQNVSTAQRTRQEVKDKHDIDVCPTGGHEPVNAQYMERGHIHHPSLRQVGNVGGVKLTGWVDEHNTAGVCFPERGGLLVIIKNGNPETLSPLRTFQTNDGKTCAEASSLGTVVLVPGTPDALKWHRDTLGGYSTGTSSHYCHSEGPPPEQETTPPEPEPAWQEVPVEQCGHKTRADGALVQIVQPGHHCWAIAEACGIWMEDIQRLNPEFGDCRMLRPGDELVVKAPPSRPDAVKPSVKLPDPVPSDVIEGLETFSEDRPEGVPAHEKRSYESLVATACTAWMLGPSALQLGYAAQSWTQLAQAPEVTAIATDAAAPDAVIYTNDMMAELWHGVAEKTEGVDEAEIDDEEVGEALLEGITALNKRNKVSSSEGQGICGQLTAAWREYENVQGGNLLGTTIYKDLYEDAGLEEYLVDLDTLERAPLPVKCSISSDEALGVKNADGDPVSQIKAGTSVATYGVSNLNGERHLVVYGGGTSGVLGTGLGGQRSSFKFVPLTKKVKGKGCGYLPELHIAPPTSVTKASEEASWPKPSGPFGGWRQDVQIVEVPEGKQECGVKVETPHGGDIAFNRRLANGRSECRFQGCSLIPRNVRSRDRANFFTILRVKKVSTDGRLYVVVQREDSTIEVEGWWDDFVLDRPDKNEGTVKPEIYGSLVVPDSISRCVPQFLVPQG